MSLAARTTALKAISTGCDIAVAPVGGPIEVIAKVETADCLWLTNSCNLRLDPCVTCSLQPRVTSTPTVLWVVLPSFLDLSHSHQHQGPGGQMGIDYDPGCAFHH